MKSSMRWKAPASVSRRTTRASWLSRIPLRNMAPSGWLKAATQQRCAGKARPSTKKVTSQYAWLCRVWWDGVSVGVRLCGGRMWIVDRLGRSAWLHVPQVLLPQRPRAARAAPVP